MAWYFACQYQYNLLNEDVQAGTEGLAYATERGIAVVIMEPLLGGALASPPPAVRRVWDEAGVSPVDVALRWLWHKPTVSVVLSGMSTREQVRQNLEIAEGLSKSLYTWHMPEEERAGTCLACGVCEEKCPQRIQISDWLSRVHERRLVKENG